MTGKALIRQAPRMSAIYMNVASSRTATTLAVMTSLTFALIALLPSVVGD
jgi:hypothetical protein